MSTRTFARDPAGISTGGRFAVQPRTEPEANLLSPRGDLAGFASDLLDPSAAPERSRAAAAAAIAALDYDDLAQFYPELIRPDDDLEEHLTSAVADELVADRAIAAYRRAAATQGAPTPEFVAADIAAHLHQASVDVQTSRAPRRPATRPLVAEPVHGAYEPGSAKAFSLTSN